MSSRLWQGVGPTRCVFCGGRVTAFQVLAGLGAVTAVCPEDVSFAESRRDALKAISRWVSGLLPQPLLSQGPATKH